MSLRRLVRLALLLLLVGAAAPRAQAQVFVVTTTDDSDDGACEEHCSLREAINDANANGFAGVDEIRFAIPGPGVHTITLTRLLPTLQGVFVNGFSQPGSLPNTNATGPINAVPLIEIDGGGVFRALRLIDARVSGLVINRAENLVVASGQSAINGCFLGTTADGTAAAPFRQEVAVIVDPRGGSASVGEPGAANRNVIAVTNTPISVGVQLMGTGQLAVFDNLIGVAKDGTTVLGVGRDGVRYDSSGLPGIRSIWIFRNVIAGNTDPEGAGIHALGCPDDKCVAGGTLSIHGNRIGVSVAGTAVPNATGIRVDAPLDVAVDIGSGSPLDANIIRYNTGVGIDIAAPTSPFAPPVFIRRNSIADNGGLGIDIGDDGPSPNDPFDADPGQQNAPVLERIAFEPRWVHLMGRVSARPFRTVTIDVFSSTALGAGAASQGETYLGTTTAQTDSSGEGTFLFSERLNAPPSVDRFLTAIAHDEGSSEFSRVQTDLTFTSLSAATGDTYEPIVIAATASNQTSAPSPATNVVLTIDGGPDARAGQGTCDQPFTTTVNGSVVTFTTPTLRLGADFSCRAPFTYPTRGARPVSARVTADTSDPDISNNSATSVVDVVRETRITLKGRITSLQPVSLGGHTVTLSGPVPITTTTSPTGEYEFENVPAGTYDITPGTARGRFIPDAHHVFDQGDSRTGLDFRLVQFVNVTGRLVDAGTRLPLVGVRVTAAAHRETSVITDSTGAYLLRNLAPDLYTVYPDLPAGTYTPGPQFIEILDDTVIDFERAGRLTLTGRVTDQDGGAGVAGVAVTLSGSQAATSTTDATGAFQFTGLSSGTYTVTVSQAGRLFDPPARTLAAITANAVADFTRRSLSTISGTITDLNGTPVSGVTVGLSGGRTETATTDADGGYVFSNLPSTNFTVTPVREGFTFSPIPRSIALLATNEDVSFVAQTGAYARYLAEGATGDLFDTQIALFNATGAPTTARLTFLKPDGSTQVTDVPLAGVERRTIVPEAIEGLESTAFSTVVESDQPIAVDRTMTWDSARYGSHAETGIVTPLTRWFFAEGATTAGFDLFYLVQNPNATPAMVSVRYLLASGAPFTKTYTIAPRSRFNVWVNLEDPRLAAAEVSADITSDVPVIVERAMYRSGGGQVFAMGHESAGVPQASAQWFFAEGATGSFFDLFFLIANPTDDLAQVEATYLKPDGSTIVKTYTVAPNSRFNIWVDFEDPALAETAVGTTFRVANGVAVVVERSMWWAGDFTRWLEGHNTAGATRTGSKWALAEGEVSGAPFFTDTFLLVANTGSTAGTVRVTLVFEDGTAPISKELSIAGSSRLNVSVRDDFPEAIGKRFGSIVESVGATRLPLVVERAMYNRSSGVDFAAGTAALGARLR